MAMINRKKPSSHYFFSLLDNRLQRIVDDYCHKLSKVYGVSFEPIHIYPRLNKEKSNSNRIYLRINHDKDKHGYYSEELNIAFSKSKKINLLIKKLKKHQDIIPLISFTSAFLSENADKCNLIGPSPATAKKYDNKCSQAELFLNFTGNTLITGIFKIYEQLLQNIPKYPFYLSASYSSSGVESSVIESRQDISSFYLGLRDINKKLGFITSKIIDYKLAPNISAVITPDGSVHEIAITDQFLNSNSHVGNIFPSLINKRQHDIITSLTNKVGKQMFKDGFIGIFGCDFLIDSDDQVYIIDLNPRHQGGYLANYLSSSVDLLDIEIASSLGLDIPKLPNKITPDYCWAQTKISTNKPVEIRGKIIIDDPRVPFTNIGSHYVKTFYEPGSKNVNCRSLGMILATNKRRDLLIKELREINKTILKNITDK